MDNLRHNEHKIQYGGKQYKKYTWKTKMITTLMPHKNDSEPMCL
jgi:hypothetical protein